MRKYFRNPVILNTASQVLARFFTSDSSFIVTLLITYYLGLESFGSFTKITAFVSFFYLFVDFGLNTIFLQKHFESAEKLVHKLLAIRFLISFILLFIIVFITILLPYNEASRSGFSTVEKRESSYTLLHFLPIAQLLLFRVFFKKN